MASNSVCPASASRCSRAGRRRGGMQRLLYYPLVNPPPPIVWQGLLYWDGIASITPHEGDYFQPLLRELCDTPLYDPLDTDSFKLWDRHRYDAMLRELESVVGEIPGEDLEPE